VGKPVPVALKEQALKKRLLASVAFISVTLAVSANAADVTGPPPPAAIWSWSGFYLGGHAGYGWGRDPFNDAIFGSKAPSLTGINSNGFVGGFQAGANWQAAALVGGLEIDLSATGIKGATSTPSVSFAIGQQTGSISLSQTDKFDMLGSARGRLGYLVWPNVLLYGTGGLAWTRLDQTQGLALSIPPATIALTSSIPSWRFGWAAGLGVETRLMDTNWLARVEYLHYDFGDSGSSFSTSSTGSSLTSGHLTTDVVRAGLSYKFGQDPLAAAAGAASWAMPVKAPRAAAVPWNWSGFYLGGHVGYGWGGDPFSDPSFSGAVVPTGINSDGFVGGFQAGANWQRGAWVGGLEVDLSGTAIKGSTSGTSGRNTVTMTDNFNMLGSARARLGYVVWPNVLLYGTGGSAWTRLDQTTSQTDSGATDPSWRFGWVAGLGVETRLKDTNWLARLEYLHYDFGDSGSSFSGSSSQTSGHLTTDVVRAGLSYKFGQDLIAAAGPANSAMPLKAPPAAALPRYWSGFYLGGHAGYGWGSDPRSDAVFGSKAPDTIVGTGIDSRGFVGGFQAGANWQRGAWVSGLEVDLSATGIKGSTTNVSANGSSSTTVSDAFNLLGSSRARLGYVVWPNVMLYGTGGLAWTRLNVTQQFGGTGTSGNSMPSWEFGWVAGIGGDVRLRDSNWLLRLEYLHYDFGNSGSNFASVSGTGTSDSTLSSTTGHLTTNVVRTGLSYKFD
jgi:opacity protein-like surface antigen